MTTPRRVPVTQDIDGEPCCIYFNPTLYRQVPTFEPQEGDIIQVSYPRSGTHWVQQIIQLILARGESVKTYNESFERVPFLEIMEVKSSSSPRHLRTHFSMSKLHLSPKAKYIYVARNPWDCCVSNYHLTRECPRINFMDGTFDDFLDAFLEAKVGFGDYFEHILSGYNHREDPNVFFITYEELQRNKQEVVLRLADFLGEEHKRVLEENGDVFEQVLEKSTVDFMKNILTMNPIELTECITNNSPRVQPVQVIGDQQVCQSTEIHILRKGVMGDWKQHFTRGNIEKMQTAIKERTKGSDIMKLWQCD
uniref:Putative salivary sulfotransferase n=1 Tax=Ixodes ricinus TaxID=34613 RepID=A0A131XY73_IXORI